MNERFGHNEKLRMDFGISYTGSLGYIDLFFRQTGQVDHFQEQLSFPKRFPLKRNTILNLQYMAFGNGCRKW